MVPEMPALIPVHFVQPITTDLLKLKILEQMKLVASLKHALGKEQKKLEIMWKEKQQNKIKKIPARKSNEGRAPGSDRGVNNKSRIHKPAVESLRVLETQKEFKQFRHFWSFYENFKDDEEEDDIKQEVTNFAIEDLVVEEVLKYRAMNDNE